MSDIRAAAWVAAADCIELARKIKAEHSDKLGIDEAVSSILETARIWTDLAFVSEDVAIGVEEIYAQRARQQQQERQMADEFLKWDSQDSPT